MTVASRYLNREILAIFVVTLLMLLMVAVGGRFIGYLQEAALGKYTGSTVLTIIGLRLPEFVQIVAPFAMYIAVVLTLGRLYAEQEMVVLQGAGVGTQKILQWLSLSVFAIVVLVALLACYINPLSQRALVDFMDEQRAQSEFETVNPGAFHIYDFGTRVTYSRDMSDDRTVLYDVFLSQRLGDGRAVNIWAATGRQAVDELSGSQFLILSDGHRYETTKDGRQVRMMAFAELRQRLSTTPRRRSREQVEALPMSALGDDPDSVAQWHWRVGMPLFTLIGALLAVGISRIQPRQSRFAKVVPGMLLMLFYYLGLLLNQNALVEGQVPQMLGLWVVHGVFFTGALWLLLRLGKPA